MPRQRELVARICSGRTVLTVFFIAFLSNFAQPPHDDIILHIAHAVIVVQFSAIGFMVVQMIRGKWKK